MARHLFEDVERVIAPSEPADRHGAVEPDHPRRDAGQDRVEQPPPRLGRGVLFHQRVAEDFPRQVLGNAADLAERMRPQANSYTLHVYGRLREVLAAAMTADGRPLVLVTDGE